MTTNTQKLINALIPTGTNLNGEPLVTLKDLGDVFIVRQSPVKMSLGLPTIETTLHDSRSGNRVYIARDEEKALSLAVAQQSFMELKYKCKNLSENQAKETTKVLVDMLGYLD